MIDVDIMTIGVKYHFPDVGNPKLNFKSPKLIYKEI